MSVLDAVSFADGHGRATLGPVSVQPIFPPRILTVSEYLELDEPEFGFSELVEGHLVMSPSPIPRHGRVAYRIAKALEHHLPAGFEVLLDLDVDLELAPKNGAGTVRRPDVLVVDESASRRIDDEGGVITAADVLLVVEIVSPSTIRTDNVVKRIEYADAGIGHYWILDISGPVTLTECVRDNRFGYTDGGRITGTFSTTAPFPVTIDLDALT